MNNTVKTSGILRDMQGTVWVRFWNAEPRYGGLVAEYEIVDMPEAAKEVYRHYEDLVASQSFSLLEELEDQLKSFDLWIIWDGEHTATKAWKVQVWESCIAFEII